MKKDIPNIFQKFKHMIKFSYLKENYKKQKINNDIIYYKEINDLHNQDGDMGTDNRLSRVADGTAHKTSQLWGTTFRFYNVLKYIKSSNMNIIDIGCDDAFVRKMIHSGTYYSGTNYIGIDIKKKYLEKASNKMPKCNTPAIFLSHDLYEGLPFIKKNTIDLVIFMEVIEHMEQDYGIKMLKDIKRCLKPGGICFISQPNHDPSLWYVIRKFREKGYPWHLREYTYEEFVKICEKLDFEIIDTYGNLSQKRRLIKSINENKHNFANFKINSKQVLKIFNRLCDMMGPEIPTQVFGQLYKDSCGGIVYVLKKKDI